MTAPDSGQPPELSSPFLSSPKSVAGDTEKIGIDEMLQRFSGEFGAWQLRHFVLTSLAWALEAFHTMVMIFADREPAWRCIDPGSACFSAKSVCGLEPGSWDWVGSTASSTVSEWGLVCGDKYKVGLVQSAFFAGCLVGSGIFGHLSDSFLGRKGSLTVACISNAVFGCLTALSPTFWVYFLLRFLTGISTGGVGLCAFVLATEPVGPSKRGTAGMSSFYFFSGGITILAGIAYAFPSWHMLYVVTSLPSLLFLFVVVPFVSESPRWYLVRGKLSDTMRVMQSITETNGKFLPPGVSLALDNDASPESCSPTTKEGVSVSLIDVIRSPVTRMRLVLMIIINFACSVVYYGLSLNVVNLKTNLYLNVVLNAVAEMPAYTITALLLGTFGRRSMATATMWVSGVFCLVGSLLKSEGYFSNLKMICGIIGIFGIAGTYNLLFIYTVELFPTVVRNAALGCVMQAGQIGAIMAPLVVVLGGSLPFAVFAACGILGGWLVFYLPETLNRPLYDTMAGIEEGEGEIGKDG